MKVHLIKTKILPLYFKEPPYIKCSCKVLKMTDIGAGWDSTHNQMDLVNETSATAVLDIIINCIPKLQTQPCCGDRMVTYTQT